MNNPKRLLQLVFVFVLTFLFTPGIQTSRTVNAHANAAQANNNNLTYLPFLFAPIQPIRLPLIYKPYPVPQWSAPAWLGPFGGSVETITADPKDPNIFYAGSIGAGIYKSTDMGVSWIWSGNGLGNLWCDSVTIDPKSSNILYAGTHGKGIYKTVDGGQSWAPVNNGIQDGAVVYSLAVNPGNTNLVYAGTRDQGPEVNGTAHYQGIMYKSADGGASWESVLHTTDDWVYSIAANPSSPDIVLAAVHQTGPYVADNYGGPGDWSMGTISGGTFNKGRVVAFDPRDGSSDAFYVTWHGDYYRSYNNGYRWNYITDSGLGYSHVFPNGIAIKPTDPQTMYLAVHNSGPAGIMKSTDGGASWGPAGLVGSTVYSVAVSSGDNNVVLAGTYLDGLYRSTDGGHTWAHSMAGLVNPQVTGLSFPGGLTVLAGTLSSGVQWSPDGGTVWYDFNDNIGDPSINRLVMDPVNPLVVFALTNSAGLRRVDLSVGSTWQSVISSPALMAVGPGTPQRSPLVRPEPLDEFLKLENEAPALMPQSQNLSLASAAPLLDIAFAPSNSNIAYVGTAGSGLFASADNGLSWTQVGLNGGTVKSVAVDKVDPNLVYAVLDQPGTVKASGDGGKNWADLVIPGLTANVAVVPRDHSAQLLIGTNDGVWMYDGLNWSPVGLQGTNIQQLAFSPAKPYWLFVGTSTGAYVINPLVNEQFLLPETSGIAIQSISFDPAFPDKVYFGTVYRGTIEYTVAP